MLLSAATPVDLPAGTGFLLPRPGRNAIPRTAPAGPDNGPGDEGGHEDSVGWSVHLHLEVYDEATAATLARQICAELAARFPALVAGVTTVSPADADSQRHQVFCDRLIRRTRRRCVLPDSHDGPCRGSR